MPPVAQPVRVSLSIRSLERALVILLMISVGLAIVAWALDHLGDEPRITGFVYQFGYEYEENIQTAYAGLLLLGCSVALFFLSRQARADGARFVRRWFVLGLIFLYIAIDEVAVIHELINGIWLEGYKVSGFFFFMWIYPAAALLMIFAIAYWRFFFALPAGIRGRVAAAGLIFVGGALGTEIPLGFWAAAHGYENWIYGAIQTAQESLELAGVSLFLAALLRHLARGRARVTISVAGED